MSGKVQISWPKVFGLKTIIEQKYVFWHSVRPQGINTNGIFTLNNFRATVETRRTKKPFFVVFFMIFDPNTMNFTPCMRKRGLYRDKWFKRRKLVLHHFEQMMFSLHLSWTLLPTWQKSIYFLEIGNYVEKMTSNHQISLSFSSISMFQGDWSIN